MSTEAIELIEGGLKSIRGGNWKGDSWKTIEAALMRTYRRGDRAMKSAEASRGEGDFHEWRKRAKDLWHELRLLERAWPRVLGAAAEEAHRLSELLGNHHDFAVLREDLGERRLGKTETVALEAAITRRKSNSLPAHSRSAVASTRSVRRTSAVV